MKTHEWGTQPEMFGPRHEHRLAMILRQTRRIAAGGRVLDGAVGLGQLAQRLQRRGFRVTGIDYSFDAALHSNSLGIPVVVGDLTRMPFKDAAFDGATTGETLEHLDDDRSATCEMGRVLKTGGFCVATVPALQSLWTASDDYYEHRRRYTRLQLVNIFRQAGFRIDRAFYWGFPVVLIYDTLFLLPMNRRRAKKSVARDGALQRVASVGRLSWLVGLVRGVFAIDRLFQLIPFGPGLLLVAHKD